MKEPTPLSLGKLASIGFSLIANVIAGLFFGYVAYRYLHWSWAVPAGVVVGFVAGFASMFRQLKQL